MMKRLKTKILQRQMLVGACAVLVVAAVIVAGVISQQKRQPDVAPKEESAYANVLKDALNVYYARYEKYPKNYQALIDDISKTPEIYGVNEEGMAELVHIDSRLGAFSYVAKPDSTGYEFTYTRVSGSKVTVKSE